MNLKKFFLCLVCASAVFVLFSSFSSAQRSKNSSLAPDVIKVGSNLEVPKGTTINSGVSIGGAVAVAGNVIGDVVAIGGSVLLKPSAKVLGSAVSIGGIVKKLPGASVAGEIKEVPMPKSLMTAAVVGSKCGPFFTYFAAVFSALLTFLGILALGISAGLIFPKRVGWTAVAVEKYPVKAFLWGVLWLILGAPIAGLLAISIIGIPLIIVEFVVYGLAMVLGYISITQVLGKKLLIAFKRYNQPMISEIVWGIALLTLLNLVPFISAIISIIVVPMSIGACWLSRLGEGI